MNIAYTTSTIARESDTKEGAVLAVIWFPQLGYGKDPVLKTVPVTKVGAYLLRGAVVVCREDAELLMHSRR